MLERLGLVLGWTGNAIATLFLLIGVLVLVFGVKGAWVLAVPAIGIAIIAWGIGRQRGTC